MYFVKRTDFDNKKVSFARINDYALRASREHARFTIKSGVTFFYFPNF